MILHEKNIKKNGEIIGFSCINHSKSVIGWICHLVNIFDFDTSQMVLDAECS